MKTYHITVERTTTDGCFVEVQATNEQNAIEKAKQWIKAVEDGKPVPAPDWGREESSTYAYRIDMDDEPDPQSAELVAVPYDHGV